MSEPLTGDRTTRLRAYIDWNNDGDFNDANENVTLKIHGGNVKRGRQKVFDQFGAATCEIVLDNRTGIYSANNTGSALYGSLYPGRAVKVEAVCAGAVHQQFYGYISEFDEPRPRRKEHPTVVIRATDAFEKLNQGTVQIPLQEDKRTDQILSAICDAIGWPFALRDFHVGDATLRFYWIEGKLTPLQALLQVAGEEPGGRLFVSKSGVLTFRRKDDLLETTKATIRRVTSIDIGQRLSDGYDSIELNHAFFTVDDGFTTVFTLESGGLALQPGDNSFEGNFTTGARNVQTPSSSDGDYYANSAPDDFGSDQTAAITVSSFTAYGGGFRITFNNSLSIPVYLTFWQIVGEAIRRSSDEKVVRLDIAAPFVSDSPFRHTFNFLDDRDLVSTYASWLAAVLTLPQPRPVISLQAAELSDQTYFLTAELQDKIKFENIEGDYPTMLDDHFHIDAIEIAFQKQNLMPVRMALSRGSLVLGDFLVVSAD